MTGIKPAVRGKVEGLDAAGFRDAVQQATATCRVSKALAGVEIEAEAELLN